MPGDSTKLSSADSLEDPDDTFRFDIEYLNTPRPKLFPRHDIIVKPGMLLMLLPITNPREGLCNGTRMIVDTTINNKMFRCTIAGTHCCRDCQTSADTEDHLQAQIRRMPLPLLHAPVPDLNFIRHCDQQGPRIDPQVRANIAARSCLQP